MLHGGAALDEADEPHRACTLPVVGEVGGAQQATTLLDSTVHALLREVEGWALTQGWLNPQHLLPSA